MSWSLLSVLSKSPFQVVDFLI